MDKKMKQRLEKRWAVVGFTHDRAKEIIEDIVSSCGKEVSRRMISSGMIRIEFADGTVLQHIRRDILHCMIMPMYFGEQDDIIWL